MFENMDYEYEAPEMPTYDEMVAIVETDLGHPFPQEAYDILAYMDHGMPPSPDDISALMQLL